MAHGNPRINICHNCNKYTLVNRFAQDPVCPSCGRLSIQTNKEEIKEKYTLSLFYDWDLNFNHWERIL